MGKWFANKGQVVQVINSTFPALAAIAALIIVFMTNLKVVSILLVIVTCGWAAFSVIMFFRNRAQEAETTTAETTSAAVSLGKIPFDYLPQESPAVHGWALLKEEATGPIPPTFSFLSANAPVTIGLSIKPNGSYGMDYPIAEAQKTRCNRLDLRSQFWDRWQGLRLPSYAIKNRWRDSRGAVDSDGRQRWSRSHRGE